MQTTSRHRRIIPGKVLQTIVGETHVPTHDSLVVGGRKIAYIRDIVEIEPRPVIVYFRTQPIGIRGNRGKTQRRHDLRTSINRQSRRIRMDSRYIATQSAKGTSHAQITGRTAQVSLGIIIRVQLRLGKSGAATQGKHRHNHSYLFHLPISKLSPKHLSTATTRATTATYRTSTGTASTEATRAHRTASGWHRAPILTR